MLPQVALDLTFFVELNLSYSNFMKLEEYQAKQILQNFKLPVPGNGGVITKPAQLPGALKKAGAGPWVIKAQAQIGGRGKAGGIRTASTPAQAKKIVSEMLGMKLVTAQTGPDGIMVKKLLVEKAVKIKRELYFSITLDRKRNKPVLIASSQGGMDIEELAQHSPDKIEMMEINLLTGLERYQCRELLFKLDLYSPDTKQTSARIQFFRNCVKAFLDSDASLLEINPLAVTAKDELLCLDAKIIIDDNAVFRHPELETFEDSSIRNSAELRARKAGISYIPLQGNIGCMVNGAGLAMATMDIIKQCGGEPANFLDVGGGANVDQVTTAFKIIMSDKNVKAILVNIFGGIMRCDVIAQGIVAAAKDVKLSVPLVVRLEGNKVDEGRSILSGSGLNISSINEFQNAAEKVVELSKQ